jgi:hypothetical protein
VHLLEKEFCAVGNERLNFNTVVMLAGHLCFRKLKTVDVIEGFHTLHGEETYGYEHWCNYVSKGN